MPIKARFAIALAEAGNFKQARELLEVTASEPGLPASTSNCIVKIFEAILIKKAAAQESKRSFWFRALEPVHDYGPGIVLGLAVLIVLKLYLKTRTSWLNRRKSPWYFRNFEDATSMGLDDDLAHALGNTVSTNDSDNQSAALLNVPILNRRIALISPDQGAAISWSEVLNKAPSIQGVSPQWLGQTFDAIGKFFSSMSPTISGWSKLKDGTVSIRLTARRIGSPPKTVFRQTGSEFRENVEAAIEEVSIRMHYLLAESPAPRTVEDAVLLRKGLAALNKHIREQLPEPLEEAASTFEQVSRNNPSDLEAKLYEGIALELLEKHDTALTLFEEVRKFATETTLKSRAAYNAAVTQLRKYTTESFKLSEEILQGLVDTETGTPQVIKWYATATLANLIANKPLFWRAYIPEKPLDKAQLPQWQKKAEDQVKAFCKEAEKNIKSIEKEALESTKLSKQEKLQLNWLFENARGNLNLHLAKFYGDADSGFSSETAKIDKLLAKAEEHYRVCEKSTPPGVETLSNLADVLLLQKKYEDAIEYTQRARRLNPRYEYAYFLEANAKLNGFGKAALQNFLQQEARILPDIKIPDFRRIFEDSEIEMPSPT